MKVKYFFLFVLGGCITYTSYVFFHAPKIISVHQHEHWADIVVDALPVTDAGKLSWWKKNQTSLRLKFNVPNPYPEDGSYNVTFWSIGHGYEVDRGIDSDSDLLCFDDMNVQANCIEKNKILDISRYRDPWLKGQTITDYSIGNSTYRQHGDSSEITLVK